MWNKKACLVLILLAGCFIPLVAAPKEKPKAELDSVAYHGTFISTNLVSAAQMALGQNGGLNLQADVNLYNRFNPCIEPQSLKYRYSASGNSDAGHASVWFNRGSSCRQRL